MVVRYDSIKSLPYGAFRQGVSPLNLTPWSNCLHCKNIYIVVIH